MLLKRSSRTHWRQPTAIIFALLLVGCGYFDEKPKQGAVGYVTGFLGGVSADEPRAALIGREILSTGGTAADAAVAAYFVNNWEVPQERLTAVGYGSERPRAANDPAQGNPVNRRMEIYVNMPALAPENK